MAKSYRFFATTSKAMEPLLAQELEALGVQSIKTTVAGVYFQGSFESAYRVCLWSRIANRVLFPIKEFDAHTPEHLYEAVRSIHWLDHLDQKGTLAVDFATNHSAISHSQFGAQKVKDAVVDQLREKTGERPSVNIRTPDVRINVYLNRNRAVLSVDLSGESLHRRGYRQQGNEAPLKENLAAAILAISDWQKVATPGNAFLDPMCGSGTLPIEAAMIASKRAPGLIRNYFGFLKWKKFEPQNWSDLKKEAQELEIKEPKKLPKIVGYDRDSRAVTISLENIERAGLRGRLHIEKKDLSTCDRIADSGVLAVNPPYGERLGEVEELRPLYRELGDLFKKKFKGWNAFVFTGSPDLAKEVGLKADRRHVLFNGAIECRLLQFSIY